MSEVERSRREQQSEASHRLVYDVPEAGAMIGLGRNASYAAAARGEIPTLSFGKLKKVPKAKWDKMLEG